MTRPLPPAVAARPLLAGLALFILPASAQAQDWIFQMDPGPQWESQSSDNYFKLRGRAYFDLADIDWTSPLSTAPTDGEEWRTARLGIEGRIGRVKYVAEFDFASDDVKTKDLNLTVSLPSGSLRLGHFKTMNSLATQTSSRYGSFMERGMWTGLFGLDRRIGVGYYWNNDSFAASAGIFGGRIDDNFAFREADDTSAFAGRVSWSDRQENGDLIHLGASVRHLDYADGGTRLRVRPNAHLSNRFAAADYRVGSALGTADSSNLFAVEAAMVRGPFHAHTELARLSLDGPAGDPVFTGGFVNAGWFLTGETRAYKQSSGSFARTSPARPVSEGGPGAWEIAARFDHADLGDAGLGTLRTWTVGLNWQPEKHVRLLANIVDGEHDGPGYVENGDAVQMRIQLDF